jgi:hypothetical protein
MAANNLLPINTSISMTTENLNIIRKNRNAHPRMDISAHTELNKRYQDSSMQMLKTQNNQN